MTPQDPDPRIGVTLGGKYRVEALLGQGGIGRVYRASHASLDAPVAVKFISASGPRADDQRERFRREAHALATLRHPGIVSVLDFGEDGGEPYLVMELVVGAPLSTHVLQDGRALPFRRIADISRQILRVLEVAHGAHVVHRDLKPDNVMLVATGDRSDHVKVLDFGLALAVGDEASPRLTATDTLQGTPMYMAPEQCRGRDVGPPADIYAMGVVLYEMLAGEPPFDAPTPVELMTRHLYVTPSPVVDRGVGRPVPADLEQLAMRALSKAPVDRPTAAEMIDELERFLAGGAAALTGSQRAAERVRAVAASRSERALQSRPPPGDGGAAPSAEPALTWVCAWGFSPDREAQLEGTLGVNGILLRGASEPAPLPATAPRGAPFRAVLVCGDGRGVERVQAVRAGAHGGLPVLVVDAAPEQIPLLVRAGASDVALRAVGDDVLGAKLWRLVRRGR